MNKILISFLLTLIVAPVFGQYNYKIEINSKSFRGDKIFFNIINNHDHSPIQKDSIILKNGHGILKGKISQPSNVAAFYVPGNNYLDTYFFVDSGFNKIQIEALKGSRQLTIKSNSHGNAIYDDLNKIFIDLVDHRPNPARKNGYLKISSSLMNEITLAQMKRIKRYPADYAALLFLYRMGRTNDQVDQAKNILGTLAGFDANVRNSSLGIKLQNEKSNLIKYKDISKAGHNVPLFKINDINNTPFSNKSLLGKNYMIVFSATWCGPCQLQLPKLKEFYEIYRKKGLKVIYFNIDDNVAKWKEHVKKNELTWINVSERLKPSESIIQKSFGVYSYPTCFVINKQGKIVYNSDDSDPNIEHLESFLKQNIN